MTKTELVINFIIRALAWGIGLGFVVGLLFQLAFLGPVTYGLFGIAPGTIAGTVLGIVNGIILTVITLQFPDPLNNLETYTHTLSRASVGLTLFGSGIIFFLLVLFLTQSVIFALLIALAASLFASMAAFYACQKVAGWYIRSLSV